MRLLTPSSIRRTGDTFGKDLRNSPIRWRICPFRKGIGEFSPNALVLTDERATIDHQELFVLKSGSKKLWVDPSKDFLPVKLERMNLVASFTE